MKTGFRTDLHVKFVEKGDGGTYLWELLKPLEYYSEIMSKLIIVPMGFVTNRASVPYKTHPMPPILHDWLYSRPDGLRKVDDRVYLEAMNYTRDVLGFRRGIRYWGVRLFGSSKKQKEE